MTKSGRLTDEEIQQRTDALQEWHDKRNSDPEFVKMRAQVKEMFKSEDELLCGFAARLMISESELSDLNEKLVSRLKSILGRSQSLSIETKIPDHIKRNITRMLLELDPKDPAALIYSHVVQLEQDATDRGASAADALHDKPGGSRDKKAAIIKIWKTGKYTTRDICAEQECAGLGLTYSTVRKHLIGTPDNPKLPNIPA